MQFGSAPVEDDRDVGVDDAVAVEVAAGRAGAEAAQHAGESAPSTMPSPVTSPGFGKGTNSSRVSMKVWTSLVDGFQPLDTPDAIAK